MQPFFPELLLDRWFSLSNRDKLEQSRKPNSLRCPSRPFMVCSLVDTSVFVASRCESLHCSLSGFMPGLTLSRPTLCHLPLALLFPLPETLVPQVPLQLPHFLQALMRVPLSCSCHPKLAALTCLMPRGPLFLSQLLAPSSLLQRKLLSGS